MNNIRKQIEVTKKTRQEIKAAFGCSDMAVWRALNYVLDRPQQANKKVCAHEGRQHYFSHACGGNYT